MRGLHREGLAMMGAGLGRSKERIEGTAVKGRACGKEERGR